jgi:hypothetical protein
MGATSARERAAAFANAAHCKTAAASCAASVSLALVMRKSCSASSAYASAHSAAVVGTCIYHVEVHRLHALRARRMCVRKVKMRVA